MERKKKTARRKNFDEFPKPAISDDSILKDTREMEYMCQFRDWHVKTGFYLALLGMTSEQMAVVFGISLSTFTNWQKKFATFREAIDRGKEQADAQVVYSLYQAAVGFEHESEQIFCSKEKIYDPVTGKLEREVPKIIRVPIRKKYPPDVKAALRWLEIRQSEFWSPKQDGLKKIVNNNHLHIDFSGLSIEELRLLNKLGVQATANPTNDPFETTTQKELKTIKL